MKDESDKNDEIEIIEENNFSVNQKSFFLTFPHCDIEKKTLFKFFMVKHEPNVLIVSKELHKDGSPHFHVWLEFNDKISTRNPRYFDVNEYHCNVGKMRNSKRNSRANVIKYMTKYDKDPLVYGCELSNKKRTLICDYLKKGENLVNIIDKYPEELYNYDKLRKYIILYNIDKQVVNKFIDRKCFWIHGPSGVGKSYLVRLAFDNLYEKQNNKWWDGYNNEEVVLLDDFDLSCKKISYCIKIGGEIYRFKAEIKGGVIQPIYKKMIVTSNYSIEELFTFNLKKDERPDYELIKAIQRRFREIYMLNKEQQLEIINLIK